MNIGYSYCKDYASKISADTVYVKYDESVSAPKTWPDFWERLTGSRTGYELVVPKMVRFAGLKPHEVAKILPYIKPTLDFLAIPVDYPEYVPSMSVADAAAFNRKQYNSICEKMNLTDDTECRKVYDTIW